MGLGPSPVPFFGQSDQPQRRWPQTTCPQPNKASADAVGRAQPHMLSMLIVPPSYWPLCGDHRGLGPSPSSFLQRERCFVFFAAVTLPGS